MCLFYNGESLSTTKMGRRHAHSCPVYQIVVGSSRSFGEGRWETMQENEITRVRTESPWTAGLNVLKNRWLRRVAGVAGKGLREGLEGLRGGQTNRWLRWEFPSKGLRKGLEGLRAGKISATCIAGCLLSTIDLRTRVRKNKSVANPANILNDAIEASADAYRRNDRRVDCRGAVTGIHIILF